MLLTMRCHTEDIAAQSISPLSITLKQLPYVLRIPPALVKASLLPTASAYSKQLRTEAHGIRLVTKGLAVAASTSGMQLKVSVLTELS